MRLVAERDRWRCTRPGCTCRSALEGHHIQSRAKGGSKDASNVTLLCTVCHQAVTSGRLKVSGRAPDQLVWEGPWGVIEKPFVPGRGERKPCQQAEQGWGFAAEAGSLARGGQIREREEIYGFKPGAASRM